MRPTLIGLKNPSDWTPGPYTVNVTNHGAPLSILRRSSATNGTLSKEKRFRFYKINSKRLGTKVGPGTYHI